MFERRTDTAIDDPVDTGVVERKQVHTTTAWWSPAQIVGIVAGIGIAVLGVVAVVRTGFDTSHVTTPHAMVWKMPHTPLLGVVEIAWGVLMVLACIVPGGARAAIALLSAIALALGIVVLVESLPNRLNHWLGVTHRSGVLFTVVGGVTLLFALFSPTFGGSVHVLHERDRERAVAAGDA